MADDHWDQVQELFDKVVGRPVSERTAILDEACAGVEELRTEVESLLEQESRVTDSFLCPPEPPSGGREPLLTDAPELPRGSKIGRYEIEGVIASGGMGTVYRAVQEQPRRTVALKVMRRNIASPSALKRFQLESHVLGRLRHANIAQVYEAGMHEQEGQRVPYFAMEYIPDAVSITRFAELERLGIRARLMLFAKVCDAVQHGHQKGVIHRDLKPGNILVSREGIEGIRDSGIKGKLQPSQPLNPSIPQSLLPSIPQSLAQPKVIDFGVARATDSDLAVTTMRTDAGKIIGTLQYMSPEQCDGDSTDIDTRSDVYSLGVVLYELLCGKLPYAVSDTTVVQAMRVITEHEPAPPTSINRKLKGDIETVLLTALQKDRERRYQSAAELAADIRRIVQREPIAARAPGAWRRMTHWIARRPLVATTTACLSIAAICVVAVSVTIWMLNMRPDHIELNKKSGLELLHGGFEARLLARSGNPLKVWRSKSPGGVHIAKLVERPAELGGGRVVVLGFMDSDDARFREALTVFDVDGDLDQPLWARRITTQDIPAELREKRGYRGDNFGFVHGELIDIFPDLPRPQIVAVFGHHRNSQRVLRIYDLAGKLLYQVWHDGSLTSFHWMPDARLLIFAGDYHGGFWTDTGELRGRQTREFVLFALQPKPGVVFDGFLDPDVTDDRNAAVRPVWFKCLRPIDAAATVPSLSLERPSSSHDPRINVELWCRFDRGQNRFGVSWLVDSSGCEIGGTRAADDNYQIQLNLPDDDPANLHLPDWHVLKLVPFGSHDEP